MVIVLLMGLVTYMDIRRERAVFREGMEQRGVLLASSLNDILANHLYFSAADQLRDIAKVVTSQPEIAYVRIFRPDGSLLVSAPRDEGQSGYATGYVDEEFRPVIIQDGQPILPFQDDTGQVVSPIMSGRDLLGVVHFGFNSDARDAEIKAIILDHVVQALALIVIGVALAYLIARYLSRSIGALATVAAEIGRGNLDVIVPSRGTKEAVELSDSLERMRAELQALYSGLEQRVAQRTHDLSRATEELKAEMAERQEAEESLRLRNQELRDLSRQLVEVQEQERRHVAGELHDEIGQLLTGLKLTLEVIPRLSEDAGKAKVDQAKTMVNELMVQVRDLSLDLRPAMLDDLGLLPSLLWYFERFTARTQVR